MTTLTFNWFNRLLNPNNKEHWRKKHKAAKLYKQEGFLKARKFKPDVTEYLLNIEFHPPCARGRDLDNCIASIKSLLDGVADGWGVNDKHFKFNKIAMHEPFRPNGKIIITLEGEE